MLVQQPVLKTLALSDWEIQKPTTAGSLWMIFFFLTSCALKKDGKAESAMICQLIEIASRHFCHFSLPPFNWLDRKKVRSSRSLPGGTWTGLSALVTGRS